MYLLFVDLTKAFDTVSREDLLSLLSKLGCPPEFISITRSFHDGMMARGFESGHLSEPFPVSNDVKQGCVLAPTLFSLLVVTMLIGALNAKDACITVGYRSDVHFFDLR